MPRVTPLAHSRTEIHTHPLAPGSMHTIASLVHLCTVSAIPWVNTERKERKRGAPQL